MSNLYWKTGGQTRNLVEQPFVTESVFEKYIFDNPDLLGDIYLIFRQIKTGSKQGIPDMIGVDPDGRICIIELKNVEAGEEILPQALGYAIWAETNPDSIKAIWLESKHKPEDIQVDWDNLDIRVVLVAPSYKSTVPRMAGKIGYPIDLVQIRRYGYENEEFVLVDLIEDKPQVKITTTKTMGDWSWDYYASEHGADATAQFRKAVEAVDVFVKRHGWPMPYNINKYYTGFKLGNRVVFSVSWWGTYAWKLVLKLPEEQAKGFQGVCWEFQTYDRDFRQAVFRPLNPQQPDLAEMEPLLVQAYQLASGQK